MSDIVPLLKKKVDLCILVDEFQDKFSTINVIKEVDVLDALKKYKLLIDYLKDANNNKLNNLGITLNLLESKFKEYFGVIEKKKVFHKND